MVNAALFCSACGAINEPLSTYCFACQRYLVSETNTHEKKRGSIKSYSAYLRIASLLSIMSVILQIIGGFLPFTIAKDGFDRITLNADSLWFSLMHTVTAVHTPTGQLGGAFVQTDSTYYIQIAAICLFLLSILLPLLIALAGLFNKRWESLQVLGMTLALLGLLELSLLALLELALNGWCGPEAMSAADCTLVYAGSGLGLTFCGCLLSVVCTTISGVLYSIVSSNYNKKGYYA